MFLKDKIDFKIDNDPKFIDTEFNWHSNSSENPCAPVKDGAAIFQVSSCDTNVSLWLCHVSSWTVPVSKPSIHQNRQTSLINGGWAFGLVWAWMQHASLSIWGHASLGCVCLAQVPLGQVPLLWSMSMPRWRKGMTSFPRTLCHIRDTGHISEANCSFGTPTQMGMK